MGSVLPKAVAEILPSNIKVIPCPLLWCLRDLRDLVEGGIHEIIVLKEVFSTNTALSGKFFLITTVGNGVRSKVIPV